MNWLTYNIQEVLQKFWFIKGLLPNLHILLLQQKLMIEHEALEFAMQLYYIID